MLVPTNRAAVLPTEPTQHTASLVDPPGYFGEKYEISLLDMT